MRIHDPDPDQHHNKCSVTSLDSVCLVARTEMLLVKGGLVVVVRRKLVSLNVLIIFHFHLLLFLFYKKMYHFTVICISNRYLHD